MRELSTEGAPHTPTEVHKPLQALAEALEPEARGAFLRAVHLAGHAVVAEICGAGYGSLRLTADAASCGFVLPGGVQGRGPARTPTEAAVIILLAGSEAERVAGSTSARGCREVTRWLTDGDPAEAAPYVEWLRLKGARAIEHPLRQRLIAALALALLERHELSAVETAAIATAEVGRYMRGQ